MDLGPRAGDIVASFEDLVFAAASVMVFLGPQAPALPESPPSPPLLPPAAIENAGRERSLLPASARRNASVSQHSVLLGGIGEDAVMVGNRARARADDGEVVVGHGSRDGDHQGSLGAIRRTPPDVPRLPLEPGTSSAATFPVFEEVGLRSRTISLSVARCRSSFLICNCLGTFGPDTFLRFELFVVVRKMHSESVAYAYYVCSCCDQHNVGRFSARALTQRGNQASLVSRPRSTMRSVSCHGDNAGRTTGWKGGLLSPLSDSTTDRAEMESRMAGIDAGVDSGGDVVFLRNRPRSLTLATEIPFLSGFAMGGSVSIVFRNASDNRGVAALTRLCYLVVTKRLCRGRWWG